MLQDMSDACKQNLHYPLDFLAEKRSTYQVEMTWACSSLVRQPYYAPNCSILKISGLEAILASEKGRWDGRILYIDEYTLIFLFSRCIRCAQKRDCWESVRFASERSRVRIPPGPPYCANPNSIFFVKHCFGFVFVLEGADPSASSFFGVSGIAWRGCTSLMFSF